jgi:hypothetical protein
MFHTQRASERENCCVHSYIRVRDRRRQAAASACKLATGPTTHTCALGGACQSKNAANQTFNVRLPTALTDTPCIYYPCGAKGAATHSLLTHSTKPLQECRMGDFWHHSVSMEIIQSISGILKIKHFIKYLIIFGSTINHSILLLTLIEHRRCMEVHIYVKSQTRIRPRSGSASRAVEGLP